MASQSSVWSKLGVLSHDNGVALIKRQLNKQQQQLIGYHPRPVVNSAYHIIFSRQMVGNEHLVNQINDQIKANQHLFSADLQKIQRQWKRCTD
ncbi:hypothetical protein [Spartinivicinus ruber]|uniref:hypothetical protein n=1 Tax=Spartinivicinus ruber TaxID=2683272 RepID=UPI0013D3FA40|nr:hypothetical protein [Spartinivicinus ruber]